MTSILTNTAAIAALATLRSVDTGLNTAQMRLSSGLRVETAADNAAYWSIATTMRSDNKALAAVEDALGISAAVVDTAYAGMSQAISVMDEIKAKLVAAAEPGVDRSKINKEIDQLKAQLLSIADSASFAGQNWMHMTDPTDPSQNGLKSLPASFVRKADGSVSVGLIKFDMTAVFDTEQVFYLVSDGGCDGIITNSGFATKMGYAQDWVLVNGKNHQLHPQITVSNATPASDLAEMTQVVDMMIGRMVDVASEFGSLAKRISLSEEFIRSLQDSIDTGIGRLVDADMNETSTRIKALQTQQQLAVQSLQIANGAAGAILQLFR